MLTKPDKTKIMIKTRPKLGEDQDQQQPRIITKRIPGKDKDQEHPTCTSHGNLY